MNNSYLNFKYMTYGNLDHALIAFINERPDGNLLRDIAMRTLADYRRSEDTMVFPIENEQQSAPIKRHAVRSKSVINKIEINDYARKNLKKLRNGSQMYKKDMAKKFGVTHETYIKYECGVSAVPNELIINVCRAFQVSVERFMTAEI